MRQSPAEAERAIELAVLRAFAPLHPRAFGVAVGTALGTALAFTTLVALVRDPGDVHGLGILGIYLRGYAVTPVGLVIGVAWAAALGGVAGWCLATLRNVVLRGWLRWMQARAQLAGTQDILDHI